MRKDHLNKKHPAPYLYIRWSAFFATTMTHIVTTPITPPNIAPEINNVIAIPPIFLLLLPIYAKIIIEVYRYIIFEKVVENCRIYNTFEE